MGVDENRVERARAGDLGAFGELVSEHRDVVHRVAARIVGGSDADDVSQDAFLRAFHRIDRFEGRASFRSWLLTITYRSALDHVSRRRSDALEQSDFNTGPAAVVPSTDRLPADRLEVTERRERMEEKLQLLAPERRAALVLRDVEGYSYEEIAVMTDSPLGTVKARLHRARNDLVQLLRANTYDWQLPE